MDSPKEPLKCWECGEPHPRRSFPCLNPITRNSIHNLQEASTVGDIGISLHKRNASLDGEYAYHQSIIVEVEGKIHSHNVLILIDQGSSMSYITRDLVEFNKLTLSNRDQKKGNKFYF
jgi:hypothetical protein